MIRRQLKLMCRVSGYYTICPIPLCSPLPAAVAVAAVVVVVVAAAAIVIVLFFFLSLFLSLFRGVGGNILI